MKKFDHYDGYSPDHDNHLVRWQSVDPWYDKLLRGIGFVLMTVVPLLALMSEVGEDQSLWLQLAIYAGGAVSFIIGFVVWVLGGGKIPSKHDIFD